MEIIEETVSEKALKLRPEVAEYTEQTIKMYGCQQEVDELEFDKALIGAVYDRFGEDVNMMPVGEDKYTAVVIEPFRMHAAMPDCINTDFSAYYKLINGDIVEKA